MSLHDNKIPFGLLSPQEQKAMKAWPHGWEIFVFPGQWDEINSPAWFNNHVYRTKPKAQTLFQYYEIRACVDDGHGHVQSFRGTPDDEGRCVPEGALEEAEEHGTEVFWTIYGVDQFGHLEALIDRKTFQAALETLEAMLVPFRRAIDGPDPVSVIEDILNQSSNSERL